MLQSGMRESPHSRSFERVNTLAKFRGMHSGFEMSEAFINKFLKKLIFIYKQSYKYYL